LESIREVTENKLDSFLTLPPESEVNPDVFPSWGGCACEMGRHVVSNSSVSIILTAPSDEDASILIGTRFVIDAILLLLLAGRP
jgi:hypothetical protein